MTHCMNQPRVGVIGLGFIGLPLALSYAMKGARVVGVDVRDDLLEAINRGESALHESYEGRALSSILTEQLQAGRFQTTADYQAMASLVDTYMITVGLPVIDDQPDFAALDAACRSLGSVLKSGDLVILRSTVVPGTTRERVQPMLEQHSGMTAGVDFHLAYSSERIAEGRAFEEFRTMPLAVGGITPVCADIARERLSFVTEAPIHQADIMLVETAKILENLQRDINIAIAQEFARFAQAAGIDTYELIRIANTHQRVQLLTPGPGVGGYCLPYALHYLTPKANQLDVPLPLSQLARQSNQDTPRRLAHVILRWLEQAGLKPQTAAITVWGLAMKDYSSDNRESPAEALVAALEAAGASVTTFDPAVPGATRPEGQSWQQSVEQAQVLVLTARQAWLDDLHWPEVLALMAERPLIMDTRHVLDGHSLPGEVTLWRI